MNAPAPDLMGQYSLVVYVHPLRAERLNLGVIVWSAAEGCVYRFVNDPGRVKLVDERTSGTEIKKELEVLEEILAATATGEASPLPGLAREFRSGLTVTRPSAARVDDAAQVLERLAEIVLPPRPFARKSTARVFRESFIAKMRDTLRERDITPQTEVLVRQTFSPVLLALVYGSNGATIAWRTASFATLDSPDAQESQAKAIYADTAELRSLRPYAEANLALAVQLPKPGKRDGWEGAARWLERDNQRVELFEDRASIGEKVPTLV